MSRNSVERKKIMERLPLTIPVIVWSMVLVPIDSVNAQVDSRIVVGVTPTCPYGILACSGAAHEALGKMEGVEAVTSVPDSYNCTFELQRNQPGLPPNEKWKEQFRAVGGDVFVFRGVEITVDGQLRRQGDDWILQVPGEPVPLRVALLEHKLQWNFRKRTSRQPEPDERAAYQELCQLASKEAICVQITGPFRWADQVPVIEVREYYFPKDQHGLTP
ncbi:hypothetical protein AYO47_01605 [Planctomyces sp. SCGC AG-212-M04]|nr:hypothetical protein AYO47_01605 [Planctomyces sp. SCGC AG-212-M04]